MDNRLPSIKGTATTILPVGRGNCTGATADMLLLFIILLVSRGEENFKSSNRCIAVLPHLRVLLENVLDCCRASLFVLCGDIELNPGPESRSDRILNESLENETNLCSDIYSILRRFDSMDDRIAKILAALNKAQKNEEQIWILQGTVNKLETIVASQQETK